MIEPAWLLILLMVTLGKVLRERRSFPANAPETLNRYVIDIALPALVLTSVQQLSFDPSLAWLVLTPWLLLALTAALLLAVARWRRWPRPLTGALLLCVPLGNTAFIGYPLTEALIGADAVALAAIYDQFGTFLMLTTYGLLIAALYGEAERPTPRDVGRRVLLFPPFIALLIALAPVELPVVVLEVAEMIAGTLVPTACLAVGLQLRLRLSGDLLPAFATGLAVKLLLMPLAALLLLRAVGAEGDLLRVGVLETAMPPMITAGAIATAAGLEPDLCAALVGFGMLLSFLTVPLALALV